MHALETIIRRNADAELRAAGLSIEPTDNPDWPGRWDVLEGGLLVASLETEALARAFAAAWLEDMRRASASRVPNPAAAVLSATEVCRRIATGYYRASRHAREAAHDALRTRR